MKGRAKAKIIISLASLSLSFSMLGVGYALWNFSGKTVSPNESISVSTDSLAGIGSLKKTHSSNPEDEDDGTGNYLLVDNASLKFIRTFYIHFTPDENMPSKGRLSFSFTINVISVWTNLSFSLPDGDGKLSWDDMIQISYTPYGGDSTQLKANETDTDTVISEDGQYYLSTIEYSGRFRNDVDLSSEKLSDFYVSSDLLSIKTRNSTYSSLTTAQKNEVNNTAQTIFSNSIIAFYFSITYTL